MKYQVIVKRITPTEVRVIEHELEETYSDSDAAAKAAEFLKEFVFLKGFVPQRHPL